MRLLTAAMVVALTIGSQATPAGAAEGLAGADVRPAPRGAERSVREGAPQRPDAERKARREQWCAENPEKCREIKARIEQRRAQCQADPERCRQELQAKREERIRRADADGNGAISRAEAERAMPGLARHFDAIDANRDGEITRDEMEAARRARAANRGRQPG